MSTSHGVASNPRNDVAAVQHIQQSSHVPLQQMQAIQQAPAVPVAPIHPHVAASVQHIAGNPPVPSMQHQAALPLHHVQARPQAMHQVQQSSPVSLHHSTQIGMQQVPVQHMQQMEPVQLQNVANMQHLSASPSNSAYCAFNYLFSS